MFKNPGARRRHRGAMTNRALELLTAQRPELPYTENLDLYGRLLGTWKVANRFYDEAAATWRENTREWAFTRILDGHGIQDVLRADDGGTGTTVRVYDAALGVWRVHWFGVTHGYFAQLVARAYGDEIRQEGTQQDGRPVRWDFSDITEASFLWRGYVSDDGGATWRQEQEMRAIR